MNNTIINVNNLGTIENNSFELKHLTILCGTNDINKHMLMYATYQLCNNLIVGTDQKIIRDDHGTIINIEPIIETELIDLDYYKLFHIPKYEYMNFSFNINNLQLSPENHVLMLPIERNLVLSEYNYSKKNLKYHLSPITDYAYWVSNLFDNDIIENNINKNSHFSKLVNTIEQCIDGTYTIKIDSFVFVSNDGYKYESKSGIIPPLAKILFPIWFFIKYQAVKNDILFIEYPELNLHSQYQLELAKLLALIVNSGIRLILSTHSDYIIREFNNMIMLFQSPRLQARYFNYPTIDLNNIAAYMLENDNIEKCDITNNDGIHAISFDKIISKSNEINDDIYYSLMQELDHD